MSNHRYSKFWWQDWENDPCLRVCSLAAQGLWMRLLCLAHQADPIGHVLVDGQSPTLEDIALMVNAPQKQIVTLVAELEKRRVFSRTDNGVIYSRRMVRDAVKSDEGRDYVAKRWAKRDGNSGPTGGPNRNPNRGANTQYSEIRDHRSEAESEARARPQRAPRGPASLHSEIMKLVHNQTNPFLKVKGHG